MLAKKFVRRLAQMSLRCSTGFSTVSWAGLSERPLDSRRITSRTKQILSAASFIQLLVGAVRAEIDLVLRTIEDVVHPEV